jgi:hypothetical protein
MRGNAFRVYLERLDKGRNIHFPHPLDRADARRRRTTSPKYGTGFLTFNMKGLDT